MTHPQVAPQYKLDGIVATIDFATGMQTLDRHVEAVKQAGVADMLLLMKADLVTEEQRLVLHRRLDDINPAALRFELSNGKVDPHKVLDLGLFSTQGKLPDVGPWLKEEAYATSSSQFSS